MAFAEYNVELVSESCKVHLRNIRKAFHNNRKPWFQSVWKEQVFWNKVTFGWVKKPTRASVMKDLNKCFYFNLEGLQTYELQHLCLQTIDVCNLLKDCGTKTINLDHNVAAKILI